MIVVIAGNYLQFVDWCYGLGMSPFNVSHIQTVSCKQDLKRIMGCHIDKIIEIGTCHELEDYDIIKTELQSRLKR